jgi:hypothetical protein
MLHTWATRLAAALLTAAGLAGMLTGTAHAGWSVRGTGGGAAAADRLAPPAEVTSSCGLLKIGASSLKISFARPAGLRLAADQFVIERSTDGGASWRSVRTLLGSAIAVGTTILFEDTGLTLLATYHYRVTAVKGNWRASAQAPPRTLVLGALGLINVCL